MFQRLLVFGASGIKSAVALIGLALLAVTVLQPGSVPITTASAKVSGARRHQFVEAYGKLPLSFEPNRGQTEGPAQFLSRGPGYTLLLSSTEAVLELRTPDFGLRNEKTPHSAFRTPALR